MTTEIGNSERLLNVIYRNKIGSEKRLVQDKFYELDGKRHLTPKAFKFKLELLEKTIISQFDEYNGDNSKLISIIELLKELNYPSVVIKTLREMYINCKFNKTCKDKVKLKKCIAIQQLLWVVINKGKEYPAFDEMISENDRKILLNGYIKRDIDFIESCKKYDTEKETLKEQSETRLKNDNEEQLNSHEQLKNDNEKQSKIQLNSLEQMKQKTNSNKQLNNKRINELKIMQRILTFINNSLGKRLFTEEIKQLKIKIKETIKMEIKGGSNDNLNAVGVNSKNLNVSVNEEYKNLLNKYSQLQ